MKFINYLESISGVSIYPMASLLLFLTVFGVVLFLTFRESKESIARQKNIPLD